MGWLMKMDRGTGEQRQRTKKSAFVGSTSQHPNGCSASMKISAGDQIGITSNARDLTRRISRTSKTKTSFAKNAGERMMKKTKACRARQGRGSKMNKVSNSDLISVDICFR